MRVRTPTTRTAPAGVARQLARGQLVDAMQQEIRAARYIGDNAGADLMQQELDAIRRGWHQ